MPALVLIVEDEPLLGRNMRIFLERQGYQAVHVDSVTAGHKKYEELHPDIVLVDHNLPDGTGLSLIKKIREDDRWTKLVMITAHGGVDLAVTAMKGGADDYLTKPVALEEISILCGKLLEQGRLQGSLAYFTSKEASSTGLDQIVGTSTPTLEIKRRIRFLTQAEQTSTPDGSTPGPPVLILGETGTGKELVARALHFDGPRAQQPFISVNCAALPEQLVESELFGHERGAFTGASEKRIGLFQAAEGGTLFLDEVGELPLAQQAKLLRVLESMTVRAVGSVRDRKINVRIVSATNATLDEKVRQGEFRSDLMYRLNTITIDVPPLRNRGDDIIQIAEKFIQEFQKRYARANLTLTPPAREALLRHPWPGNIRELRNVMEQACLICARNQIGIEDLNLRDVPSLVPAPAAGQSIPPGNLIDTERSLIVDALRKNNGNVTLAARMLGVSRDTLRYRMEKHALKRDYYT